MNNDKRKLVRIGHYVSTGKVLGKGHFATVVEAIHTLLDIKVAVKIINLTDITDKYVKNNFRREAKIMSKLCHPNVINLFEIIETTNNYYLVTEVGLGGDLCTFVKAQMFGKLDEIQAQNFGRQLVSAIGHLHDKGIIHRDLKMENILLDRFKKHLKIIDFGLSNICKFNELLKTHCGSPEYAAPELFISGKKYGPEVDIWSLGVIFYGMVTGKLPFQATQKDEKTQEEKRKFLMMETQKGLDNKHQKILICQSYQLRNLIFKMLNPNPMERISLIELKVHPWIYNNFVRGYPEPDENFQELALSKIANVLNIPPDEVMSDIVQRPYGPIGGVYNIKKCTYLTCKLKQTHLRATEVSQKNLGSNFIIRPKTANLQDVGRPKTSHLTNLNNNQRRPENHLTVEPKLTTEKMVKFFNEKFSQAMSKINMYPDKVRPKSAHTMKYTTFENNKAKYQLCGDTGTNSTKIQFDFKPHKTVINQKHNGKEFTSKTSQGYNQYEGTANICGKSDIRYTREFNRNFLKYGSNNNHIEHQFKNAYINSYKKSAVSQRTVSSNIGN